VPHGAAPQSPEKKNPKLFPKKGIVKKMIGKKSLPKGTVKGIDKEREKQPKKPSPKHVG